MLLLYKKLQCLSRAVSVKIAVSTFVMNAPPGEGKSRSSTSLLDTSDYQ
jgi:hypothetical protein